MVKIKIEPDTYLYPMPVVLIGANVKGKPNFMPLAWINIVENNPPTICISSHQNHYTNIGINENKTYSVNFPSVDMVEITDYCGMSSGKNIDKSELFEVFYGDLKTAPMINECQLNLECNVVQKIDTKKGHDLFIGEIVNVYVEDKILKEDIPDITKLQPLIYATKDRTYWKLGELVGKAWNIGKNFKKK